MTQTVDKLDPGLSKRPSRFDRKYCFSNPSLEDRTRYCQTWRYAPSPLSAPPSPFLNFFTFVAAFDQSSINLTPKFYATVKNYLPGLQ